MARISTDVSELVAAARGGSVRAAGRLLTLVESARRDEVLSVIEPEPIQVIGVTGPPGAGKSTTVAVLVGAYRARGLRVAVLAVDPSSPYSGGALLVDHACHGREADEGGNSEEKHREERRHAVHAIRRDGIVGVEAVLLPGGDHHRAERGSIRRG